MERDDEVKGSGNSYDFGARLYDSRLGRFLSIDPISNEFEWSSTYAFAANIPIAHKDKNVLKPFFAAGINPIIIWKIGRVYIRVDKRLYKEGSKFPLYIRIWSNPKVGGGKDEPIDPQKKKDDPPGEDNDEDDDETPHKKVTFTHILKIKTKSHRVYMHNKQYHNENLHESFDNDTDPDTPPVIVYFAPHSIANKITIKDENGAIIFESNSRATDDMTIEIPKNVQSFTVDVNYETVNSSSVDNFRLKVFQNKKVQTTINKERRNGIRRSREKSTVSWDTPEGKSKEKTKVTKEKDGS